MNIGIDVRISEKAVIKHPEFLSIDNHVAIDDGVIVSTRLRVRDYVHIAPYVCFIGGSKSLVELCDFSFVAAGSKIVAGSEDYTGEGLIGPTIPEEYRKIYYSTIKFEMFSGCGVNCSVMPGVIMAEGSVLGANSLLTKSTEPWTIYVGSPAKPVKIRRKDLIVEYAKKLGYEI